MDITNENPAMVDRMLPMAVLNVAEAYQRNVDPRHAKKIADNYDPVAFGRVTVGERVDGSFWVVDGQQRLYAARLRFGADCQIPCLVFRSEGERHEASLFRRINVGRKGITKYQVYKAALVERDDVTVAIEAAVTEEGFRVRPGSKDGPSTWCCIRAVGTLYQLHDRGGAPLIRTTLQTISRSWNGDMMATEAIVLGGLGRFIHQHGSSVDVRRLENRLKATSPSSIVRYVIDSSRIVSGSRDLTFCRALEAIYDKGLRSDSPKRLSPVKAETEDE